MIRLKIQVQFLQVDTDKSPNLIRWYTRSCQ